MVPADDPSYAASLCAHFTGSLRTLWRLTVVALSPPPSEVPTGPPGSRPRAGQPLLISRLLAQVKVFPHGLLLLRRATLASSLDFLLAVQTAPSRRVRPLGSRPVYSRTRPDRDSEPAASVLIAPPQYTPLSQRRYVAVPTHSCL